MSNELRTVNNTEVAQQDMSMASRIVELASMPDFDVAKLDKLMDLQEREMNRLAKIAFNKDFTSMQSEITTVTKSKQGHKYKYATLEDIVDIVRPTLEKNGFAVSFGVNTTSNIIVTCTLMHKEGHSIETTIQLPADETGSKNSVQAIGSSISYAKRYTLSSLLNIATRDDDDAQAAMQKDTRLITPLQLKTLEKKYKNLSKEAQEDFDQRLRQMNVSDLPSIQVRHYNQILSWINKAVA
ncbi:ERF family protein [uncultured Psychrobacter sp.]|uniref:ERF family protein n=1 Tax=uncultured Psychrobacter sp. TaxID=259303 RepID=UPI00259732DF|nr:ERF family protein [uncultured Psychrobacter sp.]